jgi:hypothetical protein
MSKSDHTKRAGVYLITSGWRYDWDPPRALAPRDAGGRRQGAEITWAVDSGTLLAWDLAAAERFHAAFGEALAEARRLETMPLPPEGGDE